MDGKYNKAVSGAVMSDFVSQANNVIAEATAMERAGMVTILLGNNDVCTGSYENGFTPISFKLGTKSFADSLNIGVNGMRVGGKRRLYVPPDLNPKTTTGQFPGNASLIFEVELLEVQ